MWRHDATPRPRSTALATLALAMLTSVDPARAQEYFQPLPDEYYTDDRVRFAADAQLGATIGDDVGVGAGVSISIGLQLNDIVSTYALHRLWIADAIGGAGSAFAVSTNAAMIDLTLFERVQVGAGPSLDIGIGGLCTEDAVRCHGMSEVHLGLETRLAVSLAERTRGRRRGLVISANVHPIFVSRQTTVLVVGLSVGYQLF